MKGRARGRIIAGIAGLLLVAVYSVEMLKTLSFGVLARPGAAIFPAMAAVLMALASLGVILEQLRAPVDETRLELPRGAALGRLLAAAAGLAAYVLLAPFLGHGVAGLVLAVVLVRVLQPGSWMRTVVTAAAIAASIYVLFVLLLGVPLP